MDKKQVKAFFSFRGQLFSLDLLLRLPFLVLLSGCSSFLILILAAQRVAPGRAKGRGNDVDVDVHLPLLLEQTLREKTSSEIDENSNLRKYENTKTVV